MWGVATCVEGLSGRRSRAFTRCGVKKRSRSLRSISRRIATTDRKETRQAVAGMRIRRGDFEITTGSRCYDTRARKGGDGAMDLVMHVGDLSFVDAVAYLRQRAHSWLRSFAKAGCRRRKRSPGTARGNLHGHSIKLRERRRGSC